MLSNNALISWHNIQTISGMFLNHFQHQYMTAPSNELKPVFSLLTELLVSTVFLILLIEKHLFPYCFLVVGLNPDNFMSEFNNLFFVYFFFHFQLYTCIIKGILALILLEIILAVYIYIQNCERNFQSSAWWFYFRCWRIQCRASELRWSSTEWRTVLAQLMMVC